MSEKPSTTHCAKDATMTRSLRRLLVLVVALVALAPAPLLGQTPAPEPSVTITLIGSTSLADPGMATPDGTQGPSGLIHAVLTLEIDPGAEVAGLNGMRSVVLLVEEGQLLVTAIDGDATVTVGTGEPISFETGDTPCAERTCDLPAGDVAILGPGNGFAVASGSFEMDVTADAGAVVQMSVVVPESSLRGRCWICPVINP
jgi:hypothetical protein